MIGKDLVGVVLIILSITNSNFCADDDHLNFVTELFNNQKTRCSAFSSGDNSSDPLYVHLKYPVLSKIFNDQILSKHYTQEIVTVETFIQLFDGYLSQLTKDNTPIYNNVTNQNIRNFLTSIRQVYPTITTIGLCFNENYIDSNRQIEKHYLCKQQLKSLNITPKVKQMNNKTFDIYWEPVTCSSSTDIISFPIRLIYSFKENARNTILIYFQFDARQFKLNQCETDLHHCMDETTQCIYNLFPKRQLFATGNYYCQCRRGFYMGNINGDTKGFPGDKVEQEYLNYSEIDPRASQYSNFNCHPCKQGCDQCINSEPCLITSDNVYLRGLPLAFQSFCITLCLVTGIIVFQLRRTRVVKSSNWILLELFLLGAISIYSMVINVYFIPNEITCAIQPFLREGGFVLMYGVLYVKVYRVLCSFQSRKAQRVYVRDQDILRYLGVLVIICFGHLIAWIATSFDHKRNPFSEFRMMGEKLNYLRTNSCRSQFWDVVSYLYETGLLGITIYYCKCVKSAPSEYGEVRFITIAVINEFFFSLGAIIMRMSISGSVHPDYIFIIYFVHCHVTTTISVVLLLGPKLWYLYRPPILSAGRPRFVPHSETHIIQSQQKLNGDVDLIEINLAEMDSETIRDELKRLYTQLEIYKTRAMRKDNPHVSRKRGGRKQRRFSLQHFHKKHHTSSGHDDETSKISEDSGGNSGGEEANLTSVGVK